MDKIEDLTQKLKRTVDALLVRMEALENRTIIEVECNFCKGSGQAPGFDFKCKCNFCSGIGHTFALSPLEEK